MEHTLLAATSQKAGRGRRGRSPELRALRFKTAPRKGARSDPASPATVHQPRPSLLKPGLALSSADTEKPLGPSLAARGLRVCAPVREAWVLSPDRELKSHDTDKIKTNAYLIREASRGPPRRPRLASASARPRAGLASPVWGEDPAACLVQAPPGARKKPLPQFGNMNHSLFFLSFLNLNS